MVAHAKLGASSAKRWMTCPASVPMSEGVPDSGSPHAALGSAAHALAEHCLLTGELPVECLGAPVPDEEYADYIVDEDMANAVAVYVNHIRERHQHFGPFTPEQVERRVSLEAWCAEFEGMFGTADYIGQMGAALYVDDYKHGEGEAVEAQDNPQALYYAAGALLDTYGAEVLRGADSLPVKEVVVTIAQPRKPHPSGTVRTARYTVQDVVEWLDGEVLPAVKRVHRAQEIDAVSIDSPDMEDTLEAERMFNPSEDACRWCRAKGFCKPFARHATRNALLEFNEDGTVTPMFDKEKLSPEQIARVLDNRAAVEKWLAGVESYAKMSAERGIDVTAGRYGLGTGRSTRKWGDESEASRFLLGLGLDEDSVFKRTIASPAQAEKLVGKEYKEALADLVVKTEGKPKLVKVSTDPNAKAKNAVDEFK